MHHNNFDSPGKSNQHYKSKNKQCTLTAQDITYLTEAALCLPLVCRGLLIQSSLGHCLGLYGYSSAGLSLLPRLQAMVQWRQNRASGSWSDIRRENEGKGAGGEQGPY